MDGVDGALLRLADVLTGVEADLGDYCMYCYSEEEAALLAGSVGAIPEELLASVAREVPDHWGDFANLYRKLTPRLLALLVHDDLHVDEELVALRLVDAGCWTTWSRTERDAVLGVCREWWSATLSSYPAKPEARVVLSFLATTPIPLTEWLSIWNTRPDGPADRHAQDLFSWWWSDLAGNQVTVGFWDTIDITPTLKPWILEDARPRITKDPDLAHLLKTL
ncbi:hypothetical protein ACWGID_00535 [Kribbella sp. NPDC054772]